MQYRGRIGLSCQKPYIKGSKFTCEKAIPVKRPFLLIVGLQKSGTTLLLRLLEHTGFVGNPFQSEGNEFWGNMPPFSPQEFPAGEIYQREHGDRGHEIGEEDASEMIGKVLYNRLDQIHVEQTILVNKNPYNTVRLPWLRTIFPNAYIVAMIRRPVPNVFSLLKKFTPHAQSGLPPENGWWGVKPRGWRALIDEDKVLQCARQWQAVNAKLWQDRQCVDLVINYQQLCTAPGNVIRQITTQVLPATIEEDVNFPPLVCFDDEYLKGARLRSKNRDFKQTGRLNLFREEMIELPPLSRQEIEKIIHICYPTEEVLQEVV
ncbi:sulfotransferase [candidate division KSB3 bacterium]|uniref:Sulfotransferase n=1 Tax=candidate division KSB3 bacterium TaxID=2044937 RepID=A0A9D5JW95_9BACT|nr:sulfotransferase [candidate division KSB3 bacterium]MBD3325449.1 sulfotransferase [candidate division KSB3 bacterium]